MEFAGTKMIEPLRRVVQRMHYTLEVMLVCVRWYAAYPLSYRRRPKSEPPLERCLCRRAQLSDSRSNNFGAAAGQSQQLVQTFNVRSGAAPAKPLSALACQSK